jgi:PiT family inorganic phosphate transporter
MTLLLTVLLVALIFEYINGFHDTANSIATVVSTKVLTPRAAIILAAVTNLWGALAGTAVAKTISSGLVSATYIDSQTLIAALLGAIVWNLITWWLGLPSSSSHGLVGGLLGAVLASSHNQWSSIIWIKTVPGAPWWKNEGLFYKVLIPMVASPIIGFVLGLIVMTVIYWIIANWRVSTVSRWFGNLQLLSAAYMGHSHGMNDAQKTMGIIALALVAATKAGVLNHAPAFLSFLRLESLGPKSDQIPIWIKVTCALVMAAGTAAGGWRIIRTMGHKMVRLQPVHGFAAETTGATVLTVAAGFGMPVSTTHAITASIMGVGCAKRFSALNLPVVHRILWAWVLTVPAAAVVGYGMSKLFMVWR